MREAVVLALTTMILVACATSHPPCYRGEYRACTCAATSSPGRSTGYQECNVTEDGFQACVCDGTTPGVTGTRDAGAGDAPIEASGAGAFLAPCGPDRSCAAADGVCFDFPSKGTICTKKCAADAECPSPSGGCTPKQGVCRAP